jgi:hypothetical protein
MHSCGYGMVLLGLCGEACTPPPVCSSMLLAYLGVRIGYVLLRLHALLRLCGEACYSPISVYASAMYVCACHTPQTLDTRH